MDLGSPLVPRCVERNLLAAVAGHALHPPVPVAFLDLQDGTDDRGIGRVPLLAAPQVAEGGRVIRVEPNETTTGIDVDALDVAHGVQSVPAPFPLLVDPRGFEPLTSWLPAKRSTS
jgi:hypothetical protein